MEFQAAPVLLPGGDPRFGSRRHTGQKYSPRPSDPPGAQKRGPSRVTMKCIQPTGSIYTITVSKVSVVFFLVVS